MVIGERDFDKNGIRRPINVRNQLYLARTLGVAGFMPLYIRIQRLHTVDVRGSTLLFDREIPEHEVGTLKDVV